MMLRAGRADDPQYNNAQHRWGFSQLCPLYETTDQCHTQEEWESRYEQAVP